MAPNGDVKNPRPSALQTLWFAAVLRIGGPGCRSAPAADGRFTGVQIVNVKRAALLAAQVLKVGGPCFFNEVFLVSEQNPMGSAMNGCENQKGLRGWMRDGRKDDGSRTTYPEETDCGPLVQMHAIVQVEEIIDQEKKVTHAKLSEE